MANPHAGEVEVKCGDLTLTLRLGTNAMAEIEGLLSADFLTEVLPSLAAGKDKATNIRACLWAAARRKHPSMSLFDIGDLIDEYPEEMGVALNKLLTLSMPPKEGGEKNPQMPSPEPGTT